MTVGIFVILYFFRTWLNEAYIANVPFAKSARTFICCPELYFFKKISSDFSFLISQGTISHILGAREDILFVPKYTVRFLRFCRVELFLRLYGFCTEWKISFIIPGPKCRGKNLMECCPRCSSQHCTGKNPIQCRRNTIGQHCTGKNPM